MSREDARARAGASERGADLRVSGDWAACDGRRPAVSELADFGTHDRAGQPARAAFRLWQLVGSHAANGSRARPRPVLRRVDPSRRRGRLLRRAADERLRLRARPFDVRAPASRDDHAFHRAPAEYVLARSHEDAVDLWTGVPDAAGVRLRRARANGRVLQIPVA